MWPRGRVDSSERGVCRRLKSQGREVLSTCAGTAEDSRGHVPEQHYHKPETMAEIWRSAVGRLQNCNSYSWKGLTNMG